jgi:hypothetical protein
MLEIAHRMDNTGHDYVPASYPLQPEISRLAEENERLRALLAAVVKWSDDREVSIALVEDIRAALAGREEGSK